VRNAKNILASEHFSSLKNDDIEKDYLLKSIKLQSHYYRRIRRQFHSSERYIYIALSGNVIYIHRILHSSAKIGVLSSSTGKTIFYERAQRISKILFSPREDKIHIFNPRVMFFFIILS
jgi:hypothetical protein